MGKRLMLGSGVLILAIAIYVALVGVPWSTWDACDDARERRQTSRTDTMFRSAERDVALFCPQEEESIAATVTAEAAVAARATSIAEAKATPMSLADAIATVQAGREPIPRP